MKNLVFSQAYSLPPALLVNANLFLSKYMLQPPAEGKILSVLQQRFFEKKCRQDEKIVL